MEGRKSHDNDWDDEEDPKLAIRRHTDRCFHRVEEVVQGGYIVEGIMIGEDEVAEVRKTGDDGGLPQCNVPEDEK
ncbi:hypothetical protein KS4_06370 [Poriferisphaera corsica]|uniref:Uncharacterized protein n=1 Tax=Poriferisphaera corsica TaxID=2528020 RepID=A0A517YQX8_9BACT|nr:hypothetical protein [Poriferisphaera corsica]QDU32603.1 hypothetical protein KS4_06370 [Poriferisphaera corsica]